MKIKYIQKKPFCVFVIENFLSNQEYFFIKNELNKLNLNKFKKNYGNKFSINSKDQVYKELKKNNSLIKLIHKKFNEKFLVEIFKPLRKQILLSRFKFIKLTEILRLLKFPALKKNTFFHKMYKFQVRRNIQLSFMTKNAFIQPHTDKVSKLISLMLYFPSKNQNNLNIGTHFFNGGVSNFYNNSDKKFPKEKNNVFSLPFNGRNLYGFIKSDVSWHYIKKLKLRENEIRKSININFHNR
jgi:hypothetical protein